MLRSLIDYSILPIVAAILAFERITVGALMIVS